MHLSEVVKAQSGGNPRYITHQTNKKETETTLYVKATLEAKPLQSMTLRDGSLKEIEARIS